MLSISVSCYNGADDAAVSASQRMIDLVDFPIFSFTAMLFYGCTEPNS